jgi:hypothetical protein
MGLEVENVEDTKRRKAVAKYVVERDEHSEHAENWEEWLQTALS